MVLTYHEAVEAGAEAIDSHEESISHGDETRCDTCGEVLDGSDLTRDQASHQSRAVLSAVGYADLLTEIERLRQLAPLWQQKFSALSFDAAVTAEASAYHKTECLYGIELTALREAVEGLADVWAHDDAEHLAKFGQHHPASVSTLEVMLRVVLGASYDRTGQ